MRLFRRRRKFGRQVVKVEVDPGEFDALIDQGYLEAKDRNDRELLAAAVTAYFSDALMSRNGCRFSYRVTPSQFARRALAVHRMRSALVVRT
jgi:hypothetical protein